MGVDAARVRAEVVRQLSPAPDPLEDQDAQDADALRAIGIDLDAVRAKIEEIFGPGTLSLPHPEPPCRRGLLGRRSAARSPFSARTKKTPELSLREALRLGHNFIAPEHILLGILREGKGLAAKILAEAGVDFAVLRNQLERSLGHRAA